MDIKVRRIAYRDEAYTDIGALRYESAQYRRVNNVLQGILIVGSGRYRRICHRRRVSRSQMGNSGSYLTVGVSSGFMGYFKYKERSFYLQQTADAIENEWEAVEVGVGRYKDSDDEKKRLALFVDEVHRLKSEQKKRQQSLDQPPESRSTRE